MEQGMPRSRPRYQIGGGKQMTTIREGHVTRFAELPAALVNELREMVEAKAVIDSGSGIFGRQGIERQGNGSSLRRLESETSRAA